MMKTQGFLIVAAIASLASPAARSAEHIPQCFAMSAPMVCTVGALRITLQNADCYHPTATVEVTENGQTIASLSDLQSHVEGTAAQPNGLAPWVVYTGQDGFMLKVSNGLAQSDGSEFLIELPNGERISEQNLDCSY